jgi:3-oxoacyl-(acyl-carrier-protein) synthase
MEHCTAQPIAITGIGVIGPFGATPDALWLAQGPQDGAFQPCSRFDNDLPSAEAQKIDLRVMLKSSQLSRAPLVSQFALAATHLALEQSGLLAGRHGKSSDVGIVFGTSGGPGAATQQIYDDLMEIGASGVKPRIFQESVFNAPASLVSIHFALSGPIQVVPGAGCSGAAVLYQAQLLLAQPGITAVIALCSEELCCAIQSGLRDMRWHAKFTDDGAVTSGGILGEGAVALILEKASFAKARGAIALAELAGVGLNNDAAALAFPDPEGGGLVAAIETCLDDAQAEFSDIDLVLTGSVSTAVDNQLEAAALGRIFGNVVPPQGSVKRSVGFMGGAAALIEVVLAVESLRRNERPACTGADAGPSQMTAVLCNAIGLNGLFGATLVRRAA